MLQKITDTIETHKWLWYSILGALALVFAAWGAYGIVNLNFSSSSYAAEADGQTISLDAAQNAWLRAQGQLQQQYGGNIPTAQRKAAQDQVLERLISDALISERTDKLGYRVSEPELIAAIRSEPAFQIAGQYSPEAAKEALAESGLSLDQFEADERTDLRRQQLLMGIASSEFVTPAEAARAQALRDEEREVQYAILPADSYKSDAPIDPAAIAAYYKAHQADYLVPESVDLRYAQLTLAQVASTETVSDAGVQAAYDKEKSRFVLPERREASHILIPFGKDPAAALKQADKVLALAKSGQNFAALAKKYSQDPGSAQNGGSLGWMDRNGFVKPFADALFSIKSVGDIVGPVKSPYGYHIIRLDGIQPGRTKTLAEARPELVAQLEQSEASNRFGDIEDRLQNRMQDPGVTLDGLAKEFNLTTGEVPQFLKGAGGPPLGEERPLQNLLFGANAISSGTLGGPVILDNDKMVIFEAAARHPPHVKPLADVRDSIVAALTKQRESDAALAAAQAARSQLLSGASFDQVAKNLNVKTDPPKFVGRGDPSVPAQILSAAFDAAKPVHSPVYEAVTLENGGAALIAITQIRSGEQQTNSYLEQALEQQQLQRNGQADALAYLAQMRATAKVRKNPDAFQ
ncbi:MAG TPA: SurA N-terminal domain-containing protein [Steroidobacteraceae bacterium]|nr:SurA N-terminal domain-containing protein [Steroidobacteraceae bacterium]